MKVVKAEEWTLDDSLTGDSIAEINGELPLTDPDQNFYKIIASDLQGLTWDNFEDLTASLLKEIGFCDVHRLTRGSQQGKDIIAIWYSRFSLGQRIKFRFQCKHKQTNSILRKPEVGDSISDFLVQEADEILVIVSNSPLTRCSRICVIFFLRD